MTLRQVSQQWAAMGLDQQRLDDLLELVASGTQAPANPDEDEADSFAEDGTERELRGMSREPGTIVDWNKLLALAAGQLGDVKTRFTPSPVLYRSS